MNELTHSSMLLSAELTPHAEALRLGEKKLQYKDLEIGSANIASCLCGLNPEREQCVGIFMIKSIEAILSIYGIMRSGAVYVPIDTKNPAQRIQYIIDQCKITTLITLPEHVEYLNSILIDVNSSFNIVVLSEESWDAPLNNFNYVRLNPAEASNSKAPISNIEINPDDLATILYTSGSTGTPKGVMISHSNISIFTEWACDYFKLQKSDRCISHAPLHFDLSLFDIFATHSAGACAVLIPDNMAGNPKFLTQYIESQEISIWQSVPSVLVLLIKYGDISKHQYHKLRHVLFAGERISARILEDLSHYFNKAAFHNVYGATETNDTFVFSIPSGEKIFPDPLPIGKPLAYVDFLIVDENNNPVLDGEEGMLLVKTPTQMRGYRNASPDVGIKSQRIETSDDLEKFYITNDVVKVQPDGNTLFCGRTDDIVKSNGYRINLLEIETTLQSHPLIRDAAVISMPDDEIGNRIIAVVTLQASDNLSVIELKIFCANHLPKYAIPHVFEITRDLLPKTSSGKTNKKLLIKLRSEHVQVA